MDTLGWHVLLLRHPPAGRHRTTYTYHGRVQNIASGMIPGTRIPETSKRWFRVRDRYGIEIAPGHDDVVVLAVAVAVDSMADRAD